MTTKEEAQAGADVEYIDTKLEEYKCACGRKNLRVHTTSIRAATAPKHPDIAEKLAGVIREIKKYTSLSLNPANIHVQEMCTEALAAFAAISGEGK